jgi:hypothetical protein
MIVVEDLFVFYRFIFSLGFCVLFFFGEERVRITILEYLFVLPLMCAGNAVPVMDVLSSSNSRRKRRRDLKGFIILGVVSLLFFQKEALSFPKGERTLQLGFVRWRNF